MARTHLKILFVAKTEDFLREKREERGNVTVVTLMTDERFAAKKDLSMTERVF